MIEAKGMLSSEELVRLVKAAGESEDIDAKGPVTWDNGVESAGLAKDIAAFSNSRKGGYLVIGKKEEEPGKFESTGVTPEQAATFETTKVATWVNNHFSPPIGLVCYPAVEHEGKRFVVIQVFEFSDVPTMCVKSFHRPNSKEHILREQAIYVRNVNAESVAVGVKELPALIGLATRKRSDALLADFDAILQGRPLVPLPTHEEQFQHELEGNEKATANDRTKTGEWFFAFHPSAYNSSRWQERDVLEGIIRTNSFRIVQEFPPCYKGTIGNEWGIVNIVYGEPWAFTRSGLFLSRRPFREDVMGPIQASLYVPTYDTNQMNLNVGQWIEYSLSLRVICEAFLFLSRMADAYDSGEMIEYQLTAKPLAGRYLVMLAERASYYEIPDAFGRAAPCQANAFCRKRSLNAAELRADWKGECINAMKDFLELFPSHGLNRDRLQLDVEEFLEARNRNAVESFEIKGEVGGMSNGDGLPKGWATVRLDEAADISLNRQAANLPLDTLVNFVPMPAVKEEFGGIDISTLRPFGEVQKGYTQFREGDVLFAKITPCMENGKVAVVPRLDHEWAYGSTEFHVLRPRCGIVPDWLAHFLSQKGFRHEAQRNMTGSAGQLRVPKNWLQQQPVPVAPTNEQRRIVAKIEELFSDLDAGVAALERAKAKLKRYRAAVLKAAVEGKLTEEWRANHPPKETASQLLERILKDRRRKWEEAQLSAYAKTGKKKPPANWKAKYKGPAAPDETSLPALPDGWCWTTVEQLTTLITKGSSPGWQGFEYVDDGILFVRSQNVRWGAIDLAEKVFLPRDFNNTHQNSVVQQGDVLLNLVGASIGRSAVATAGLDGANLNQAVAIIRLLPNSIINQLLVYFFLSPRLQGYIAETKADVARANFNLDDVRPTPLPLPPTAEQQQIVAEVERRLSIAQESEFQIEANLKRSYRLRQGILKRAFEGKLVPQDPNDEAASIPLEQVKARRDGFPCGKKADRPLSGKK